MPIPPRVAARGEVIFYRLNDNAPRNREPASSTSRVDRRGAAAVPQSPRGISGWNLVNSNKKLAHDGV